MYRPQLKIKLVNFGHVTKLILVPKTIIEMFYH